MADWVWVRRVGASSNGETSHKSGSPKPTECRRDEGLLSTLQYSIHGPSSNSLITRPPHRLVGGQLRFEQYLQLLVIQPQSLAHQRASNALHVFT